MSKIKESSDLLDNIDYWTSKYEFDFQFYPNSHSVFISKGGVNLYESFNHDNPTDAIKDALQYVMKINPVKS